MAEPRDRLRIARWMMVAAHGRELSQNQLGELAGIAWGVWSQLETGAKPLTSAMVDRIVAIFARAGMPYITRIWIEHGVSKPGDPMVPDLIVGPVTIEFPPEETRRHAPPAPESRRLPSTAPTATSSRRRKRGGD